ncbi:hypothetical protein BCR44DRAFT_34140 [Catenaria anguillulae PL171]|uniref:Uncharacterized protein n=1 Tax=Catenaria anguillulae PL171 TaxID=765915 RepID=A0A1Y2HUP9_9FUNG|nr:hypothetical protein BCR44DRAFT_34140 [Catenaria anguillulae PL171]
MEDAAALHTALCTLLQDPALLIRNMQATLHVLGQLFGPCPIEPAAVRDATMAHPLHNGGNEQNTPLYSCKLAATIVAVLAAEPTIDGVKAAATRLSHTAGAFASRAFDQPNKGEFSAALAIAIDRAINDRKATCLCVNLSDTIPFHTFPPPTFSLAHSFTFVVFPHGDDSYGARVYQAFGPPDIGYKLTVTENDKVMMPSEIAKFRLNYQAFETSKRWAKAKAAYKAMFGATPRATTTYPIKVNTRVVEQVLDKGHIEKMLEVLRPVSV